MPDSDVIRVGTDSGGRELYMTRYMQAWWEGVVRHLGWRPTIVQGAWMSRAGGGVSASDGFHDYGGCLDLRTWDRTDTQKQQMIRVLRSGGAAAWVRFPSQGFDEHIHLVLGTDPGIGYNAAQQFRNYLGGDAGLSGSQTDYHWRPDPMVTVPPASYMTEQDWFDMATEADLTRIVRAELDRPEFIAKVAAQTQQAVWDRDLAVTGPSGATTKNTRALLRELWQKHV